MSCGKRRHRLEVVDAAQIRQLIGLDRWHGRHVADFGRIGFLVGLGHHAVGLELLAEELGREVRHRLRGLPLHGRAGADTDQAAVQLVDMFFEPAQQAGHLDAPRTAVGVHLVQHQEPEVLVEEHAIFLAEEEVLEHRVVRHEDVGKRGGIADLLAVPDGLPGQVRRAHLLVTLRGALLVFGRIAGVARKCDAGPGQILREALVLVVRQRVHRVEDDRADARARMLEAIVQDGQEESLGLAGSGATRDDRVAAGQDLFDRLLLVGEKPPLAKGGSLSRAPGRKELLVQAERGPVLRQCSFGALVRPLQGQEWAPPQEALLVEQFVKLPS